MNVKKSLLISLCLLRGLSLNAMQPPVEQSQLSHTAAEAATDESPRPAASAAADERPLDLSRMTQAEVIAFLGGRRAASLQAGQAVRIEQEMKDLLADELDGRFCIIEQEILRLKRIQAKIAQDLSVVELTKLFADLHVYQAKDTVVKGEQESRSIIEASESQEYQELMKLIKFFNQLTTELHEKVAAIKSAQLGESEALKALQAIQEKHKKISWVIEGIWQLYNNGPKALAFISIASTPFDSYIASSIGQYATYAKTALSVVGFSLTTYDKYKTDKRFKTIVDTTMANMQTLYYRTMSRVGTITDRMKNTLVQSWKVLGNMQKAYAGESDSDVGSGDDVE